MSPYKCRELPISVNTKIAALIGWPLGHSASAEMHNDAYAAMGLDAIYLPLPVAPEHLKEALTAMSLMGFIGCNVTIPHKVAAKELMDELDQSALESGAVNTVLFHKGLSKGYNTDGTGFVRALESVGGFNPAGARCLLIGAGGAARGVASALAIAGTASFVIANRAEEFEMAQALAFDMNRIRPGIASPVVLEENAIKKALSETELVVHATRLGMSPETESIAFNTSLLCKRHFVCDVVYSPRETRLLREASERGCRTLDGMWMLVYQGAEAIRIWTELEPPSDVMAKGCEHFLSKQLSAHSPAETGREKAKMTAFA